MPKTKTGKWYALTKIPVDEATWFECKRYCLTMRTRIGEVLARKRRGKEKELGAGTEEFNDWVNSNQEMLDWYSRYKAYGEEVSDAKSNFKM